MKQRGFEEYLKEQLTDELREEFVSELSQQSHQAVSPTAVIYPTIEYVRPSMTFHDVTTVSV